MNHPAISALLVILALWSVAGAVWFQMRRPRFKAQAAAARWAIAEAGPVVWMFYPVTKPGNRCKSQLPVFRNRSPPGAFQMSGAF